jgi:hypothetical protein
MDDKELEGRLADLETWTSEHRAAIIELQQLAGRARPQMLPQGQQASSPPPGVAQVTHVGTGVRHSPVPQVQRVVNHAGERPQVQLRAGSVASAGMQLDGNNGGPVVPMRPAHPGGRFARTAMGESVGALRGPADETGRCAFVFGEGPNEGGQCTLKAHSSDVDHIAHAVIGPDGTKVHQ